MTSDKILLIQEVSIDELENMLNDVFDRKINQILEGNNKLRVLWTRQETAKFLGISLPTLNTYTKQGIIKGIRYGNIVRYSPDDIEASAKEIRTIKHQRTNP